MPRNSVGITPERRILNITRSSKSKQVADDVRARERLDELKFRSRNTIGCRAFTNAALEFVLEKYGDELVKMFKNK